LNLSDQTESFTLLLPSLFVLKRFTTGCTQSDYNSLILLQQNRVF